MSWLVNKIRMSVGGIAINTPNYKSAAFPKFAEYW
jgi:glucan biosynthesis protein